MHCYSIVICVADKFYFSHKIDKWANDLCVCMCACVHNFLYACVYASVCVRVYAIASLLVCVMTDEEQSGRTNLKWICSFSPNKSGGSIEWYGSIGYGKYPIVSFIFVEYAVLQDSRGVIKNKIIYASS